MPDFEALEKRVRVLSSDLAAVQEQVKQQEQRWQAVTGSEPAERAAPDMDIELFREGLIDTDRAEIRTQFLVLLIDHFDLEELTTVAFNIGVRWANLRGDTLEGKARELLLRLEREEAMYKLVAECQRQRPGVLWPTP